MMGSQDRNKVVGERASENTFHDEEMILIQDLRDALAENRFRITQGSETIRNETIRYSGRYMEMSIQCNKWRHP